MTTELTAPTRQHVQILRFMALYRSHNDQLPCIAAISAAFGWASVNAASEHLQRMERLGLLCRNEAGNIMLARTRAVAAILGGSTVDAAMVAYADRMDTAWAETVRHCTRPRRVDNTDARLNAHIAP